MIKERFVLENDTNFLKEMQHHCVFLAIGPSTLRNQGTPGVIAAAQNHLNENVKLSVFNVENEDNFLTMLDNETEKLCQSLPREARHWGAARKALNIFLREVFYNRYLGPKILFKIKEEWLEIPLDNLVAKRLKKEDKKGQLPFWKNIKTLRRKQSYEFQRYAKQFAATHGITRIHLDMRLWTEERLKINRLNAINLGLTYAPSARRF